jgi:formylglycine-generating enzyme required for sulfatase activity
MKMTDTISLGLLASAPLLGLWLVAGLATAGDARPELVLDLGDNVTMKLVRIPAGKFLMGSPANEKGRWLEEGVSPTGKTQVEVTISKPFYMGEYTVTVEQFQQFVKDSKHHSGHTPEPVDEKLPATWLNMSEAQAFCQWLSTKSGKKVLLPTEAQWEYACRAGTTTRFWFGDKDEDLYKYGNYCDKNEPTREKKGTDRDYRDLAWRDMEHDDGFGSAAPVGSYKPNPWGLYDMHGNVWQICRGWYADNYPATGTVDPAGPGKGFYYVLRGGSFVCRPSDCRSASRERRDPWNDPHNLWPTDGFRVIVSEESPAPVAPGTGQTPAGKPAAAGNLPPKTTTLPYKVVKLPELVLDLGEGVSMKFVKIPAGKFTPVKGGQDDKPGMVVEVGSFYMGVCEVTKDAFDLSKIKKMAPPYPQTGTDAAAGVAGKSGAAFCAWMSQKTGKFVRFATVAEWQYAARAGTTTKYYFGDDPTEMFKYENVCDQSHSQVVPWRDMRYRDGFDKTAPVGSFPPNPWGLHDMLGNVHELTSNVWPLYDGIEKEPAKVFYCGGCYRGAGTATAQGAWGGNNFWNDHIYPFYGLRVAISVDPNTGEAMPASPAPAAGGAKAKE